MEIVVNIGGNRLSAFNDVSHQQSPNNIVTLRNNHSQLHSGGVALRDRFIIFVSKLPCFKNCNWVVNGMQRIDEERKQTLECFIMTLKESFDECAATHVTQQFGLLPSNERALHPPLRCRDIGLALQYAANHTQPKVEARQYVEQSIQKVLSQYNIALPKCSFSPAEDAYTQKMLRKVETVLKRHQVPDPLVKPLLERVTQSLFESTSPTQPQPCVLVSLRQGIVDACQGQAFTVESSDKAPFTLTLNEIEEIDGHQTMDKSRPLPSAKVLQELKLLLSRYQVAFEKNPQQGQSCHDHLLALTVNQGKELRFPPAPLLLKEDYSALNFKLDFPPPPPPPPPPPLPFGILSQGAIKSPLSGFSQEVSGEKCSSQRPEVPKNPPPVPKKTRSFKKSMLKEPLPDVGSPPSSFEQRSPTAPTDSSSTSSPPPPQSSIDSLLAAIRQDNKTRLKKTGVGHRSGIIQKQKEPLPDVGSPPSSFKQRSPTAPTDSSSTSSPPPPQSGMDSLFAAIRQDNKTRLKKTGVGHRSGIIQKRKEDYQPNTPGYIGVVISEAMSSRRHMITGGKQGQTSLEESNSWEEVAIS